jgi:small neutral amino acid transporter SnatA (MarC family)
VTFALMVAGFLGTLNVGRVALAYEQGRRSLIAAAAIAAALVVAAVVLADDLLDALDISPESFEIAAGIVLAAAGARALVSPSAGDAPPAALLVRPDLVVLAISLGATDPNGKVLAAAAVGFLSLPLATRRSVAAAMPWLAALEIVVAAALAVAGIQDV